MSGLRSLAQHRFSEPAPKMLSGPHKQNVTAELNLYEMSYKPFRLTERFIRNSKAGLSFPALVRFGF